MIPEIDGKPKQWAKEGSGSFDKDELGFDGAWVGDDAWASTMGRMMGIGESLWKLGFVRCLWELRAWEEEKNKKK